MRKTRPESEVIGVNISTATNRLKKNLMFRMMQDLGEDECYRCGGTIETVEEASIEHKIPYMRLARDGDREGAREAFWDLDNVAFSHFHCNSSAAYRAGPERTHCSNGHSLEKYGSPNRNEGGRSRVCRECGRIRWHKQNRAAQRTASRVAKQKSGVVAQSEERGPVTAEAAGA